MSDTLKLSSDGKAVVLGKRSYPLAYGFQCPISGLPVAVLVRSVSTLLGAAVPKTGGAFTEGKLTGLYICVAGASTYVPMPKPQKNKDEDEQWVKVRYFFGLKEDSLIEKVYHDTYKGRPIKIETFKRKLLAGQLKEYRISRELVGGEDLLITHCDELSKSV